MSSIERFAYSVSRIEDLAPPIGAALQAQLLPDEAVQQIIFAPRQSHPTAGRGAGKWLSAWLGEQWMPNWVLALTADDKVMAIITGANQGGKSIFLRSIGLAQLMMQCGMFVPAESFCANMCDALFTHYRREEDATMTSGKLDEELSRMSEMVDHMTPNALLLFNESFVATNEREGSEIARQIVSALVAKRIKVFFVTHLYTLAHGFYAQGMAHAVFLVAERRADGERTFRIIEGEPSQTSQGEDLYARIFSDSGSNGIGHDAKTDDRP